MANPPSNANVKLLCHFDGTNGQTTTVDSSSNARTLTAAGGEALSTAQSKFGGSSSVSAASGSKYWSAADSDDWHFGSGQFTIEGWIYFTSAPASVHALAAQWAGSFGWFFGHVSGALAFYYSTTGSDNPNVGAAWTPTLNTWHHIAVDRDASNVLRVYLNGVVHASSTITATFFNSPSALTVGGNSVWFGPEGYVDEVRVVKAEAVYGGAFTPPAAPFSLTLDPIAGAASITLGALLAGGAGGLAVNGSATVTLGPLSVNAAGDLADLPTGVASITLGALLAGGAAGLEVEGAAAITLGAVTLVGEGFSEPASAPAPAPSGIPEIRPPTGTPFFLLAGHGITPKPIYADVPMRTGQARRRRLCTAAPRVVTVGWFLEADEMAAIDAWFEDVLHAGERQFWAQIKAIGPGLRWWIARWIEPYAAEAYHLGRWRVTGQLLITGDGQVEDPYSPALSIQFGAAFVASAALTVTPLLEVEYGAAFARSFALAVEYGAELRTPARLHVEFGAEVT